MTAQFSVWIQMMSECLWVSTACFHKKYGFANIQYAKDNMKIVSKENLVFECVIKYLF